MGRLGVVVEPLKKSLEKVETNVNLLEQQRQRAYGEIHKELELSRLSNEGLSRQTGSLVSALKGESHTRGRWGEIQLRRVIEMAGMLPHCDFEEQQTIPGEDGGILRPDVIVKLPGGKSIVIDAKVSLSGYLRAHEEGADDEAQERRPGRSCEAGTRPRPAVEPEGVLAPATGDARLRGHVHARRVLPARRTGRRPGAVRAGAGEPCDPRHADER